MPQSELFTAITLDTKDYKYKALTVDLLSETKRTDEELRIEREHHEEMERLRNDPLNQWNQERLEILMAIDEERQKEKRDERMVSIQLHPCVCVGGGGVCVCVFFQV